MDYKELQRKKALYEKQKATMPAKLLERMEQEFEDQFTYDSLSLSGSSLTLEETKAILAAKRRKETGKTE
ncbi:hypothetical protein AAA086_03545 [Dysosmobacter welbionis]|uniref:hypothetical protein n=1 Tax=Dysosmobacter welbionis TaxID=2093857 RepID=UPI0032BF73C9